MSRLIQYVLGTVPAVLVSLVLTCVMAVAAERINVDESGVAIKGYDTVAYFTDGKAIKGGSEFSYEWQGAKWYFANDKHRKLFAQDPNRYAPRYGGHCAGAMALGRIWTVDPEAWAIVDGRLYLNFLISGRDDFVKNPGPLIQRANANWKEMTK